MSKALRDFIKNNRAALDDKEPSGKVWGNIQDALPDAKQRSLWNSVSLWRAAAILFMGLSTYFFMAGQPQFLSVGTQTGGGQSEALSSASLQKDLGSLESFYSAEIASKVAMINTYENANDLDQFTQDFQKLDAMYLVLKEEMKVKPSQKVKDALILNMLIRIDLLNQQLHRLDKVDKDSQEKKNSNV